MNYTIQNAHLKAEFSSLGAELRSLVDVHGRQWIWQGNPEIWGRHAPLCFLFVGRLAQGSYEFQGKTYQMPTHGFARGYVFTCKTQEEARIVFVLESSEESKKLYPFEFSLEICYELEGTVLKKSHTVENLGKSELYYELGGHDGYCLGFQGEDDFQQCSLLLEEDCSIFSHTTDETVMIQEKMLKTPVKDSRFSLNFREMGLDCYILPQVPHGRIFLCDKEGVPRVGMYSEDFAYLLLWTCNNQFYCLEPWTSLPDCSFVGRDLRDKVAVRCLAGGARETLVFSTEFFV